MNILLDLAKIMNPNEKLEHFASQLYTMENIQEFAEPLKKKN